MTRVGMRLIGPLLLAVCLLLSACGGDDDEGAAEKSDNGATTSTTAEATPAPSGGAAVTSTTAKAGTATTSTVRPAATTTTLGPPPPAPSSGVTGATPGKYVYQRTGKSTTSAFGEQSLDGEVSAIVEPMKGSDQRSVESSANGSEETVLRYSTQGASIAYLKITQPGINKEFRPPTPVLAVPLPPSPGRQWSWKMTSTDGATTVEASFKIVRTENVTVGTENVPTSVIDATITTSGDITSTQRATLWISERYRLSVQTQQVTDGNLQTVTFHSESTDKLRSTKPT